MIGVRLLKFLRNQNLSHLRLVRNDSAVRAGSSLFWSRGRVADSPTRDRMLLSCKICAFGIILIHPGMAAECTAVNIVTRSKE